jgi:hypothetical protein
VPQQHEPLFVQRKPVDQPPRIADPDLKFDIAADADRVPGGGS